MSAYKPNLTLFMSEGIPTNVGEKRIIGIVRKASLFSESSGLVMIIKDTSSGYSRILVGIE